MSKSLMAWRGELISSNMSKEELLEIIRELGSQLQDTQDRASLYLSAADPVKLLNERSE